jgi:hypothetical protein
MKGKLLVCLHKRAVLYSTGKHMPQLCACVASKVPALDVVGPTQRSSRMSNLQ